MAEEPSGPLSSLPRPSRLAGRIVLVAGASHGLGAAAAIACAAEGARLILVGRTRGALEEVDDAVRATGGEGAAEGATLVAVDLGQDQVVENLGGAVFQRFGRLDGLLVTAAELGMLTPVAQLDPQLFAQAVSINLLVPQRLIRSLDPLLRASPAGRAVFVTCQQAALPSAYWGVYAAGKAGLEALVKAYAAELRLTNLRANLVDPGPMATPLRARAFPGEPADRQPAPATLAPLIADLLTAECELSGELVRLR